MLASKGVFRDTGSVSMIHAHDQDRNRNDALTSASGARCTADDMDVRGKRRRRSASVIIDDEVYFEITSTRSDDNALSHNGTQREMLHFAHR